MSIAGHPGKTQGWSKRVLFVAVLLPWLTPPHGGPSPAIVPWLVTIACMAVLVMGYRYHLASTSGSLMTVAWAWIVAGALNAIIALCQYFGFDPWALTWYGTTGSAEAYGSLRQKNHFATLTNIGLVAVLSVRQPKAIDHALNSGTLSLVAALLAVGNAASASRTGLVGLLLITALAIAWSRWRRSPLDRDLAIALVAYAVAGWLLPALAPSEVASQSVYLRFASAPAECATRTNLWSNMLELVALKPWLGWGWGELDYAHFITEYSRVRQCEFLDNAHNLPLQIAVECGIPLALLATVACVAMILRGQPWRETRATSQMGWLILMLIALHSLVEYPLWFGTFAMTAVLCLFMVCNELPQRVGASGNLNVYLSQIAGGFVLIFVIYMAWDYYRISQIYLPPEQRATAYREHTLEKIRDSWLFREQVRFAEYTITPLTRSNAEQLYAMGLTVLHFSPEASVVEKLVECAVLLGRDEEARFYLTRYKAAFPNEHARWAARQREPAKP